MEIIKLITKKLKIKTLAQCEKYSYDMFSKCDNKALRIYYNTLKKDINNCPTESKYIIFNVLKKVMNERGLYCD